MRQVFLVGAALFAGFVGGILGTGVMHTREQSHPDRVVRARSFELMNEAGQAISFWGVDNAGNAVLAFGSNWPETPGGGSAPPGRTHPRLDDRHNQRAAIGVIDDIPFLHLTGADGKTRVRLYLSDYGKPFLLMEDETGPRVALGVDQSDTPGPDDNDWALTFYPERVWLGMKAEKDGGQMYVRGGFSVDKGRAKYPFEQAKGN